jgi:hypothetical protein
MTGGFSENTDRELWRERPDDYYAPSIHVTQGGAIGINVGGAVYVKPLRAWHELAVAADAKRDLSRERKAVSGVMIPPADDKRLDTANRPLVNIKDAVFRIKAKQPISEDDMEAVCAIALQGCGQEMADGGNWHPDWPQIMKDCGGADKRANDLVMVTRETTRLAASAIRQQNGADAYHNFMAAERELLGVLED